MRIDHDVVRAAQPLVAEAFIKTRDFAGAQIDLLDPSPCVAVRHTRRTNDAAVRCPGKAAVVADVAAPIFTDRCAVRAAPQLCDHSPAAVRQATSQGLPAYFDHQHGAIGEGYRALRKC